MADHEREPSSRPEHAVDGRERGGEIGDVHQPELAVDPVDALVGDGGERLCVVLEIDHPSGRASSWRRASASIAGDESTPVTLRAPALASARAA